VAPHHLGGVRPQCFATSARSGPCFAAVGHRNLDFAALRWHRRAASARRRAPALSAATLDRGRVEAEREVVHARQQFADAGPLQGLFGQRPDLLLLHQRGGRRQFAQQRCIAQQMVKGRPRLRTFSISRCCTDFGE
jgi:hypothetical protein